MSGMYISYDDLKTGIAEETLTVISRGQNNAEQAIREAEAEVSSYLSARYDIAAELSVTGGARNQKVFQLVRDIAIYKCYVISTPAGIPNVRRQLYEDALAFLKDVQSEKAALPGLARLDGESGGGSSYVRFGGNKKRRNQWQ